MKDSRRVRKNENTFEIEMIHIVFHFVYDELRQTYIRERHLHRPTSVSSSSSHMNLSVVLYSVQRNVQLAAISRQLNENTNTNKTKWSEMNSKYIEIEIYVPSVDCVESEWL